MPGITRAAGLPGCLSGREPPDWVPAGPDLTEGGTHQGRRQESVMDRSNHRPADMRFVLTPRHHHCCASTPGCQMAEQLCTRQSQRLEAVRLLSAIAEQLRRLSPSSPEQGGRDTSSLIQAAQPVCACVGRSPEGRGVLLGRLLCSFCGSGREMPSGIRAPRSMGERQPERDRGRSTWPCPMARLPVRPCRAAGQVIRVFGISRDGGPGRFQSITRAPQRRADRR